MRKSTLFISIVLTTFMLAVLFGVVSAYQRVVNTTDTRLVQAPPTQIVELVGNPIAPAAAPVQNVNITPEEAVAIASKVMNQTDVYTIEVTQLDGVDAYLVTFSSGDLVYVGLDGQILSVSKLPVTVITQVQPSNNGGNGGGGSSFFSSGDHDEHEEHEEHDDD